MTTLDNLIPPASPPTPVMTEYLAAAKRGDWEAAYSYFSDDIVVRIPGRSAFAGEHHGRDAAIDYIQSIREHFTDGGIELEVIDMLFGRGRVALLVEERFHGDGPPVTIRRTNVYRVHGGQIVEVSIFEGDQYAVDALAGEVRAA